MKKNNWVWPLQFLRHGMGPLGVYEYTHWLFIAIHTIFSAHSPSLELL